MATTTTVVPGGTAAAFDETGAAASAVSWSAILVGAVAAATISLVLLLLGSGLGLSSISPWSDSNPSGTTFGVAAAIWIIVVQWISAGLGGYLAGRLRTKWTGVHTDEVFFRDTAHGFMTWCTATLFTAAFLASATSAVIGGSVQTTATVISGATQGATQGAAQGAAQSSQQGGGLLDPIGYYTDTLLRSDRPDANAGNPEAVRTEIGRILARGLRDGDIAQPDRAYLAQVVANRTGLSPADAQKRVDDLIGEAKAAAAKAKDAADQARKAAALGSIMLVLSMFVGAFVASVAGAYGGRLRDEI
jgi:hypothetical protein